MSDNPEQRRLLSHRDASPDSTNEIATTKSRQRLEGTQLYITLAFPNIALLLVAIDLTLTTTVSATIAADFSSLAIISWLGTAYLVALAAIQPISGKLTDVYGRRLGFLLALLVFGIGNAMCGLSQSIIGLIAGRALAGLGGGAISSITAFVISDLVPLRQRALWQGIGNITWAGGIGIGAAIGGLINDLVGWRWAFIAIVPLTVAVAVGTALTLHPGTGSECLEADDGSQIDVLGGITLTTALVSLVLGLNLSEDGTSLLSTWIPLAIAASFFVCFIVIELRFTDHPIVPIHLLKDRSVCAACLSGLMINGSMQSLIYYVPLMIQVRGFSASETGLQMLGEPIGASTGSLFAGLAMQALGNYATVKPTVFLIYLIAPFGFTLSNMDTPIWATVAFLAAMGSGYGGVLTLLQTGLLAVTEQRVQATAMSMYFAFRQVGASAGLALSGILFRLMVSNHLNKYDPQAPGAAHRGLENIAKACNRRNFVGGRPPEFCVACTFALHWLFAFALVLGLASFLCGMLIRNALLDRDDDKSAARRWESESREP